MTSHILGWAVSVATGLVALMLALDQSSSGISVAMMQASGHSTRWLLATTPLVASLCLLAGIPLVREARSWALPAALGLSLLAGASELLLLLLGVPVVPIAPTWLFGAWLLTAAAGASLIWAKLREPSLLGLAIGAVVAAISEVPPVEDRASVAVLLCARIAAAGLIVWGLLSLRPRVMQAWHDESASD